MAALRIKRSLADAGERIDYIVAEKRLRGSESQGPGKFQSALHLSLRIVSYSLLRLMKTKNPIKHSLNLFSSGFVERALARHGYIHLHWINNETVSLQLLAYLVSSRPVIVTLHDEWLYCGAEHCAAPGDTRFEIGYEASLGSRVGGVDWNCWLWRRKMKYREKILCAAFTAPSTWLADRARRSALLSEADVHLIPNPVPTEVFVPAELPSPRDCRLNFVILFGAVGGAENPLKGGDLLVEALRVFFRRLDEDERETVRLRAFGGRGFADYDIPFVCQSVGHVSSMGEMAKLYREADVTVVPSRVESFGQVAAESLSCGTPVVAFNHSGLVDIVDHMQNGYLAEPFSVDDLANGLEAIFRMTAEERQLWGAQGRKKVVENFSEKVVAEKFAALYESKFN